MRVPASPLKLPEARAGKFSIKHKHYPAGYVFPVVSFRTAFCTGQKPQNLILTRPRTIHQLEHKDDGKWMSDIPQELVQMAAFAKGASGEVLIAGLGLGLLAHLVAKKPEVKRVDIIEISPEVIHLCGRKLPRKCRVIQRDIVDFIKSQEVWPWDRAYFDTWQCTSEIEWHNTVLPLRRLMQNKFGYVHLQCWAEDEMKGQVVRSLQGYTMCPENVHSWKWYRGFRNAAANIGYPLGEKVPEFATVEWKELYEKIMKDRKLQELLSVFVNRIGTPRWEALFNGTL
jgi:hypothetical protein